MSLHALTWKLLGAARAVDVALTRREGRRSVLIDSSTAMNYIMAAPIQAAFAGDPRVRFYTTSTAAAADVRAIYRGALPGTRVITPRAAALKRFDVYLSADLLWAPLAPRRRAYSDVSRRRRQVPARLRHAVLVHATLAPVVLRQPPPHAELRPGRSD